MNRPTSLLLATIFFLPLAGCDGGILVQAEAKSKAACACADADCVREHVKWFNEQSLKDGGKALEGLSPEDTAKYEAFAIAAGDCQAKIASGGK